MTLDTFITIAFAVMGLVGYGLYIYGTKNVYLKYKDQRVGGRKA